MIIPDKITAYLNKRASSIWQIENDYPKHFQMIMVVPSIAESDNLPNFIRSLEQNDKLELHNTLLLIVINNSFAATAETKKDNQDSLAYLKKLKSKLQISFIDAASVRKEVDVQICRSWIS